MYSNYLTTNESATYSTPNRWDNTYGKRYYTKEKIPNNSSYNNSFNEFSNNHFRPYYQNSCNSYDSSWKSANIKRNLSSNENAIDYRKQEPNTICYIEPSQQQKRNCLQMIEGLTKVLGKDDI